MAQPRGGRGGLAAALAEEMSRSTLWPLQGCCVGRGRLPRVQVTFSLPSSIRTTVDGIRGSTTEAAPKRAPGIRTTVTERLTTAAAAAATTVVEKVLAVSSMENSAKKAEESSGTSRERRIAAAFTEILGPALMQAPLALLAPWGGALSGISMSMMPFPPPPPPNFAAFQRMPMAMPPGLQEEEQFAALIFPGFNANAFVWQITCWQIAEFVFSMLLGHNRANPTSCVLYGLGASWGPAVARGEIWRLITPVMLHANLTHLLFNVFFQLRMGFGMEKQFGRGKMMAIYFACGVFGNLCSITMDPFKLAVGASTAGFGLIGVWLAEILLSWEVLGPAKERTVIWIAFMLVSVTTMTSMTPNMDLYGHFGGALGGFLLSIIVSDMDEKNRPEWYSQARVAAAVAFVMILTGGLSKALLINPRDPIPDCHLIQDLMKSFVDKAGPMTAALTR